MGTRKSAEQTLELKYTGYLTNSQNVFLHYGINEWNDVSECKMRKLKTCYKTEVVLPSGAELRFCFRNGNDEWDNNFGNDYAFVPGIKNGYDHIEICNKKVETEKTPVTRAKSATDSKTKTRTKKVASKVK